MGFGLGPRVLIGGQTLEAQGLSSSVAAYATEPCSACPKRWRRARAARPSRAKFRIPTIRVTSFNEAQPGLRRFFSQMATYLGLIGLVSLLVGGIGVASAVSTFMRRQRPTIAILKCPRRGLASAPDGLPPADSDRGGRCQRGGSRSRSGPAVDHRGRPGRHPAHRGVVAARPADPRAERSPWAC